MFKRKGAALLAASALFACASLVQAAEPSPALTLDQPKFLANQGPANTSLMGVTDKLGLGKPLSDFGLTIGGWIQGGWTYNSEEPAGGINVGRVFDFEDQDLTLHQIVLYIDKGVDSKKWDIGGRMEWMWGGDARLIHSNGMFDHYGIADGPDEQFDPTQAYLDFNIPVANGIKVRVGKFVTPIGFEVINPNLNPLYSHSYLFGFAIPFTQSGIVGYYQLSDQFGFFGGVTRGWEQSLEDNNDACDFLGGFSWVPNKQITLYVNTSVGPQQTDNTSNLRYLIDASLVYKASDQWTFVVNGDYAWEENAASDGDDASWYGIAGYLTYSINEMFAVQGRAEYFNDDDGARGLATTVYEFTIGLDIKPLVNNKDFATLRVRPEIRWDLSDDDLFDGGQEDSQLTFGIDVLFQF